MTEVQPQEPATKPGSSPGLRVALVAAIALAALVAIALVIAAVMQAGDEPSVDGYDAQVACKDFVRDRLKAPATADFSGLSHTGGGDTWTVRGAVDAENSFGVPLRMDWTCRVRLGGDTWYLESLTGLR